MGTSQRDVICQEITALGALLFTATLKLYRNLFAFTSGYSNIWSNTESRRKVTRKLRFRYGYMFRLTTNIRHPFYIYRFSFMESRLGWQWTPALKQLHNPYIEFFSIEYWTRKGLIMHLLLYVTLHVLAMANLSQRVWHLCRFAERFWCHCV